MARSLRPPAGEPVIDSRGMPTPAWLAFWDSCGALLRAQGALAVSTSHADDAAAAAGGVAIGDFYRSGNTVKVRVG